MDNNPFGLDDEFRFIGTEDRLSSASVDSIPTPFTHNNHHEGPIRTNSPGHDRGVSDSSSSIIKKPLPSTATLPPPSYPQDPAGAKAPLLSPSSKSKHQVISTRGNNWNWEVGALILSCSALITLIVLLIYVDGRPLSQWNGAISLNTVISGLGAISRASLGFSISSCLGQIKWNWFKKRPDNLITFDRIDDASRGAWGSFWLIVWLRTCHWATLGAIATIILLGFEPFLQAVVSFSGQTDVGLESSAIQLGRSEALDVGSYSGDPAGSVAAIQLTPSNKTVALESFLSLPDMGMTLAFDEGFYNSDNAKRAASFTCPTANCTWPTFTSLAICSACNNIESHLQSYDIYGSNLGTFSYNTVMETGNYTTRRLPFINITNLNGLSNSKDSPGSKLFSLTAYMVAARITDSRSTLTFQHIDTMITALQILKAAPEYGEGNLRWEEAPVSATECVLYFCTNAYESSIKKGTLTERIVESWAERDFNTYRETEEPSLNNAYDKWNNHTLYSQSLDFSRNDLELFIPEEDIKKYGLPNDVTQRFKLTENTVGSTVRYVNDEIFGSSFTWPVGVTNKATPISQALYQSESIPDTFDRVAWTVSNRMRDISNVTNPGVGQEWVIHIHVQWLYMILPLLATALGLLFSLWSIYETRKLHLDPWKTDMIATLTRSVDAETRAQLRHADRNGYLDKAVKAMTVTFEDTGYGLELRIKQG
ncbi:hypothetical protein M426DRAFT_20909 [Hypoxylon sp. CI-4A]|nr:hypothetical protein M426DRAFT_20909 [Hypoxylon sp. CI-4A]